MNVNINFKSNNIQIIEKVSSLGSIKNSFIEKSYYKPEDNSKPNISYKEIENFKNDKKVNIDDKLLRELVNIGKTRSYDINLVKKGII